MTIMKSWSEFYQVNDKLLSKGEHVFLEVILFITLYEALIQTIRQNSQHYLRLLKSSNQKEYKMTESHVVRFIINDIISSNEYTLEGIAYYINTPQEVVYDVASGSNANPSLTLARKIIELHRMIKPDLYRNLMSIIANNTVDELDPGGK